MISVFFSVMDLGVDMTSKYAMSRKGVVYPWVKSGVIGYGYGHKRDKDDEDYNGVCSQVGQISNVPSQILF